MRIRSIGIGLALAMVAVAMGVFGGDGTELAIANQGIAYNLRTEPASPVVGEHFTVFADLTALPGGDLSMSLSTFDVDPDGDGIPNIVREQERKVHGGGESWRMYAQQPGRVQVGVSPYYEKIFDCEEYGVPPPCTDWTSFTSEGWQEMAFDIQPAPSPRPDYDANDNGEINSLDALWVLQSAAGLVPGASGKGEVATLADSDLTLTVTPGEVNVGDHIVVTASVPINDEETRFQLRVAEPDPDGNGEENVFYEDPERRFARPRPEDTGPERSWRYYALEAGPVTFEVSAMISKSVQCDDPFAPEPDPRCPAHDKDFSAVATFVVEVGPDRLQGDVNGDGRVGSVDAALILQYAAGLLPIVGGG